MEGRGRGTESEEQGGRTRRKKRRGGAVSGMRNNERLGEGRGRSEEGSDEREYQMMKEAAKVALRDSLFRRENRIRADQVGAATVRCGSRLPRRRPKRELHIAQVRRARLRCWFDRHLNLARWAVAHTALLRAIICIPLNLTLPVHYCLRRGALEFPLE